MTVQIPDPPAGVDNAGWRRRRGAQSLVPDTAPLSASRTPSVTGEFLAEIPVAGVFLGTDRSGRPAVLPAVQPRPIRIGLLGVATPAVVLAHRLLAVGCQVTVVTLGSPHWRSLHARINSPRLTFVDRPVRWPMTRPGRPGTNPGPQALIVDAPMPPPPGSVGNGEWCTVVHAAAAVPVRSEFWQTANAWVLTERGHARAAAQRWPRQDVALADDLRPGEVAVVDSASTRAVGLLLTHIEQAALQAAG